MPGLRILLTCVPLLVGALVGGCVEGGDPGLTPLTSEASPTYPVDPQRVTYAVALSGAAVVPGPAPSTAGDAEIRLEPARGELCYTIAVDASIVGTAVSAHLHEAPAGATGDVVLNLKPPVEGAVKDCAVADSALLDGLTNRPEGFYLVVHSTEFPNGALRGQLR